MATPSSSSARVSASSSLSGSSSLQSSLRPLTSAAVVCRQVASLELPHVVALVSDFLDFGVPQHWSIARACERNHLRLLQRLVARSYINSSSSSPPDGGGADADGTTAASITANPLYRAHLFSNGLVFAVQNGNMEMAQWLCANVRSRHTSFLWKAMKRAVKCGNLRFLQWVALMYHPDVVWSPKFMDSAAKYGHLDVLEWLNVQPRYNVSIDPANDCVTDRAMNEAARNGHVVVVKWLLEHYFVDYVPDQALRHAIVGGHLEIAKMLHEESGFIDDLDRIDQCGASGNLDMVKWILDENIKYDLTDAMEYAGGAGHLHILQWLHEFKGETSFSRAMRAAAANGHFEVMKWLHERGTEGCTHTLMDNAAAGGYLEIVKWLHANRTEGASREAMDNAARYGYLDVIQWLHENRQEGCTIQAMGYAAWNGHLEIVKWLQEHRSEGCTTDAMDFSSTRGNLDVIKWLHENRSEGCTTNAMNWAAAQGRLAVVQWLHEHRSEGCTTQAMDTASSVQVLQWLHENRTEGCTTKAMDNAAYKGDFDMLLFLHMHRTEGCTFEAARHAVNGKHFEILRWLCEKYPEQVNAEALRRSYSDDALDVPSPTISRRQEERQEEQDKDEDDKHREMTARADGDDDNAADAPSGGEFTRKWTEREEAALIAYWRENVAKYATKTKRFFYDEAARIPELRQKTTAQIKSKCFDTEKRYRDTNHMLRAAGVEVSDGADPDASRKWVLKKFSLYYDVHPFLGPRDPLSNGLTGEDARGINGQVGSPEPPAAGVRSFVAPATGKKRVLNGHAANVESSTPPRVVSKRHRAEIERFVKVNEETVANANVNTAANSNDVPAGVPTTNGASSLASSGANAGGSNPNQYAPHVQENSAMVEAATEKMRAEARLATIRANAALLRERKALLNEGISVEEINALLPLEPPRVV